YTKAEQQMDKDSAIVPVYYYVNARLVKPWVGGYTGKDPLDNTYTRLSALRLRHNAQSLLNTG
ncbi:hypothetical protein NE615_28330, partial [Escherichia coli]|uniref:hypothetical protein n=1 Tax=Escherichia coli TaxID=562 RepID=UPI00210CFC87